MSKLSRIKSIKPGDLLPERQFKPDNVQLFLYNSALWNAHRIHYDHRYVTEVEGYPDLVVHGPLIALLLLDAGSRRLGGSTGGSTGGSPDSFSYRAVSPLFCGEEFTIAGRANPEDETEVWAAHPERGLAMRATLGST